MATLAWNEAKPKGDIFEDNCGLDITKLCFPDDQLLLAKEFCDNPTDRYCGPSKRINKQFIRLTDYVLFNSGQMNYCVDAKFKEEPFNFWIPSLRRKVIGFSLDEVKRDDYLIIRDHYNAKQCFLLFGDGESKGIYLYDIDDTVGVSPRSGGGNWYVYERDQEHLIARFTSSDFKQYCLLCDEEVVETF